MKFTDILSTFALVIVPTSVVILTWIVIAMELLQFYYPKPW